MERRRGAIAPLNLTMTVKDLIKMTDIISFAESIGMEVVKRGNRYYTLCPDGFRIRIAKENNTEPALDEKVGSCVFTDYGIYDFAINKGEGIINMAIDFLFPNAKPEERSKNFKKVLSLLMTHNGVKNVDFSSDTEIKKAIPNFNDLELTLGKKQSHINYAVEDVDVIQRPDFIKNNVYCGSHEMPEYIKKTSKKMSLGSLFLKSENAAKYVAKEIAKSRNQELTIKVEKEALNEELIEKILKSNGIPKYEYGSFLWETAATIRQKANIL